MILKGKTCILRTWKKSDAESLQKNANNKKIWDNLIDAFPHPYTKKHAEEWIKKCNTEDNKKKQFAIEVEGKAVGNIGFSYKKPSMEGVIGYWLGEPYWGKGIMTEALKLTTEYAFRELKLKKMSAKVFLWNPASARVLEKAGYKYEKILKAHTKKNGIPSDDFLYSISNNRLKQKNTKE